MHWTWTEPPGLVLEALDDGVVVVDVVGATVVFVPEPPVGSVVEVSCSVDPPAAGGLAPGDALVVAPVAPEPPGRGDVVVGEVP